MTNQVDCWSVILTDQARDIILSTVKYYYILLLSVIDYSFISVRVPVNGKATQDCGWIDQKRHGALSMERGVMCGRCLIDPSVDEM